VRAKALQVTCMTRDSGQLTLQELWATARTNVGLGQVGNNDFKIPRFYTDDNDKGQMSTVGDVYYGR